MKNNFNSELINLSKSFGTPLYVYDSQKITENYNNFKNAFKVKDLKIHYACKALSSLAILKLFKELGANLDTVSVNEVKLGLKAGFSPENIIFTPNGVCIDEYAEAINLGVHITVDNLTMLEKIGIKYRKIPVHIRINPHIMAGGHNKISVGHIDSKFGISIHQLPIIKRLVDKLNIRVEGIHIHTGSDIYDPEVFTRVASLVFSIAEEFRDLKSLDFGSGFKVKYREGDHETDIAAIGKTFSKVFNDFCKKIKKDITLRFEPGKYMVSNAGFFLVKANTIKQTTACTFIIADSGFNHLIRPMFYGSYHEIENISNPKGQKKLYSVVGNLCESDTFAEDRLISEVHENDILMFRNAGAYCYSMSSNYNSRFRPAEILIYKGKAYEITARETFEDILRNQKIPEIKEWK